MKFAAQVQINRPLEQVLAYVSNYLNDPVWIGPMVDVQKTPDSPVAMGTTVSGVAHFLGRRLEMNGKVTSYKLNRKIWLSSTIPFRQLDCRICQAVNGDTLFSIVIKAAPSGILRIFEPILAFLGRRQTSCDVQALKEMLESQAQVPWPA